MSFTILKVMRLFIMPISHWATHVIRIITPIIMNVSKILPKSTEANFVKSSKSITRPKKTGTAIVPATVTKAKKMVAASKSV